MGIKGEVYDSPHGSELQAVKRQSRLARLSYGCIALLISSMYLYHQGFRMTPLASALFLLLCISTLARAVLVFRDGFFARGRGCVMRGGWGIAFGLIRLGGELMMGVIFLVATSS